MFPCIAYFDEDDPQMHATMANIKSQLRALGVASVGFRSARHWRGEIEPCRRMSAPGYPQIERAYAAAGVPVVTIDDKPAPPIHPSRRIPRTALPVVPVATVVCAGPRLLDALAKVTPVGEIIAVNRGAHHVDAHWWIALDGFKTMRAARGNPRQVTSLQYGASVDSAEWFACDEIGISGTGIYSSTAGLRLAEAMGARTIHLIGHEAAPGQGIGAPFGWDRQSASNLRTQVASEMHRLRKAGIEVIHYGPQGQMPKGDR